jgi:large subunit ribosomal protein L22e
MPALKKISKKKAAKVNLKFILDCTQVAQDQLLQPKNFSEFLQQKIKVQNKTGNLGDSVKVETDDKKVTVKSTIPLSKRYLKYLAKKYLKRNNVNPPPNASAPPLICCPDYHLSFSPRSSATFCTSCRLTRTSTS